jgi:hypothetical protein
MAEMTNQQAQTLRTLCERYGVAYDPEHYTPAFDLPTGWVNGWVGGREHATLVLGGSARPTIYVGVSPEGEAHS